MDIVSPIQQKPIACFLIINPIPKLSDLALLSVLRNTDVPIAIGYVNESDLPDLANDSRVLRVKLNHKHDQLSTSGISNGIYQDFSQENFYQLVQLKWTLFAELLSMGYTTVFYSDVDVVWLQDPIGDILKAFAQMPDVHWFIQSFTSSVNEPKLCMGFVAFRNSSIVNSFIKDCAAFHARGLGLNPKLGDDDVVTSMYRELNFPSWIKELPQAAFPVGSMVNLYSKKNLFPGLKGPTPYIFHANYVVGISNKILLLEKFLSQLSAHRLGFKLSIYSRFTLTLKSIRIWAHQIKSTIFQ